MNPLLRLRKALLLSQSQLSEQTETSIQFVRRQEQGLITKPSRQFCERMIALSAVANTPQKSDLLQGLQFTGVTLAGYTSTLQGDIEKIGDPYSLDYTKPEALEQLVTILINQYLRWVELERKIISSTMKTNHKVKELEELFFTDPDKHRRIVIRYINKMLGLSVSENSMQGFCRLIRMHPALYAETVGSLRKGKQNLVSPIVLAAMYESGVI